MRSNQSATIAVILCGMLMAGCAQTVESKTGRYAAG